MVVVELVRLIQMQPATGAVVEVVAELVAPPKPVLAPNAFPCDADPAAYQQTDGVPNRPCVAGRCPAEEGLSVPERLVAV